jgi:hypothetical protein
MQQSQEQLCKRLFAQIIVNYYILYINNARKSEFYKLNLCYCIVSVTYVYNSFITCRFGL